MRSGLLNRGRGLDTLRGYLMILTLEKVSGLSDADPIHRFLKVVDGILKDKRRWSEVHRRLPQERLLGLLWDTVGHPIPRPEVTLKQMEWFRYKLELEGETVLANVVHELLKSKMTETDIRLTMMYIIGNLEYLKTREAGRRSIDDGWIDE
jgi:hypothetical protein